jgi:hypothetical protein
MCELTTLALMATSAAVSAAGGMISSKAMNAQANQQNEFQRSMMARNKQMRDAELQRQDEYRLKQEAAMKEGQENLTYEARMKQMKDAQAETQQNVDDLTNDVKQEVAAVPGIIEAQSAGNVVAEADYAKRIKAASADARKKIQALTGLSAYDMAAGNRGMMMDNTNADINLWNNFRKGSLATTETGMNLLDRVAANTTIAPQTNMLATGQLVSGLGNMIGSATAGGTAQKAVKNLFG